MTPIGNAQGFFVVGSKKIRYQKHDTAPVGHAIQILQCRIDICTASRGLKIQQLSNDAQHMLFALFGGDKQLDFVGKNDQSHAIVILYCGKGEQSANLSAYLAFHLRDRSKVARCACIHHQYHGEFALLVEHFDKGVIHTRCHVPVDCANIIAGLVFSHFCKRHPSALKYRMVLAGKNCVYQIARTQLNALHFFEDFSWNHDKKLEVRSGK